MGTYDPQDALNQITPQLANVTLDATAKGICADDAHRILWNYAPWRWERKILPNIAVVDGQQDYTGGSVPSDFMGLLQAELVITSETPNWVGEMEIKSFVHLDPKVKVPLTSVRDICFLQELNSQAGGFRITNPQVAPGQTAVVRGVYRKLPTTKYSSANLTTDFTELPDQYFYLYVEWLLWRIYRYIGDPRAGTATFQSGRWAFTGQLAQATALTEQVLLTEDFPDTDVVHPAEAFGHTGVNAPSVFP